MQHLNNEQPCHGSLAIKDFRDNVLNVYQIHNTYFEHLNECLVTVITRHEYDGRTLERVWVNEGDIVSKMQSRYPSCTFRVVDFVLLTMSAQIQTIYESSMVLGMHGAGMANVMWLRESKYVVEIFPRNKFRYGYRNLCQYLGCHYHQYRGGFDLGKAANKKIESVSWFKFLDPIMEKMIANLPRNSTLERR